MKRRIASAVGALLVAGASLAAASSVNPPKPVYRVDSVSAAAAPGAPNRLVIQAQGAVRSGGWENAKLRVRTATKANTMIIVFVAIPPAPNAIVVQAVLPVKATVTVPMPKATVTTVQIAGETNSVSAKILR
jgi:hypothetical protein